jgi:hypothetical protein
MVDENLPLLINLKVGEEKAQSCAIACYRQLCLSRSLEHDA